MNQKFSYYQYIVTFVTDGLKNKARSVFKMSTPLVSREQWRECLQFQQSVTQRTMQCNEILSTYLTEISEQEARDALEGTKNTVESIPLVIFEEMA